MEEGGGMGERLTHSLIVWVSLPLLGSTEGKIGRLVIDIERCAMKY